MGFGLYGPLRGVKIRWILQISPPKETTLLQNTPHSPFTMSDYDEFDDCDRDEFDDDSVADNWEDEDEEQENKKIEEERKKEEEKAQKEAAAAKKREERERREAMAGRLEADENDAVELDGAAAREFKDRLDQHEVELAYESTNTFSSKPIHSMQPTTPEEFAQMGEKIGGCMKTFQYAPFFEHCKKTLCTRKVEKKRVFVVLDGCWDNGRILPRMCP